MNEEKKFVSLRSFNLFMGILHLVQGLLVIFLSNSKTCPIFSNYLSFDKGSFLAQT